MPVDQRSIAQPVPTLWHPTHRPPSGLRGLFLFVLALLAYAIAGFGGPMGQDPNYHHFADQGQWGMLKHPLDVLSNLLFLVPGCWGVWRIHTQAHLRALPTPYLDALKLFVAGLMLTGLGSGWYHLDPTDASLVVDRLGMAVAFAGLLGVWTADQLDPRWACAVAVTALVTGFASVILWRMNGNLLPWVVLQVFGLLVVLGFSQVPRSSQGLSIAWWVVGLAYLLAKVGEMNDHAIHEVLNGTLSGHTLKHVWAGLAALPIVLAGPRLLPINQGHAAEPHGQALPPARVAKDY